MWLSIIRAPNRYGIYGRIDDTGKTGGARPFWSHGCGERSAVRSSMRAAAGFRRVAYRVGHDRAAISQQYGYSLVLGHWEAGQGESRRGPAVWAERLREGGIRSHLRHGALR